MLICWLAPRAGAEVYTVKSMAELNKLLQQKADEMESRIQIRLDGKLAEEKFDKVIVRSQFFSHSRKYRCRQTENGEYEMEWELVDSARMLAAFRTPALESRLTPDEQRALKEARKRVRRLVKPGMKRLEILKALHDDLVRKGMYDTGSGPDCTAMLLHGKGVCDAYARSLYLMLHMVDVPCLIVVGDAGEPHAWNLVNLGKNAWVHVDATWNDPESEEQSPEVRHSYFCLSDKEMRGDHKWKKSQYPATPRMDAMYFRKSGLYFSKYDAFWEAAEEAYEKGDASFEAYLTCYRSHDAFKKAVKEYAAGGGKAWIARWSPPVNDKKGALTLTFFHRNGGKPQPEETEMEEDALPLPIEKNPSWMDSKLWKELVESIDVDAMMKTGGQMLRKGIDAAQEAAENIDVSKESLMKKYEGLKKFWE